MKWMQFFRPAASITWDDAIAMAEENGEGDVVFLDVRQPREYEAGHYPGARLLPLGELDKRLGELPRDKPLVVYCAVGGRSRVAVQMLSGQGFDNIYNLSGGIKAWQKTVAVGPEDTGMHLFSGKESVVEIIVVAYGLERGLQDFYLRMMESVGQQSARQLLSRLADIEVLHQERLLSLFKELSGDDSITKQSFAEKVVQPQMEGGMTTEQYLALYDIDFQSVTEILGMAMAIEAQALDLYLRAAEKAPDREGGEVLYQIAQEERGHMVRLSQYIDEQKELT